ncbi:16S rRNA (guanine(966)-N(2))-methyltransferase RsmD [Novilysobacter arseniciresistens]|uniref:16S rRNA (guanine(966)-N(2))-methyltransferase RsmD n=1 Tax=Novilysobacter arseniciresistens TaxID=1385522 RepID=UPI0006901028|nr:16S rRNA (guanine(966)-N(2))-methyltransferase RsmD [Lysobacter arseniciresistens]
MKKPRPRRTGAAPAARQPASRATPGQVRIIGGRWRGSRLPVLDIDGLRPTSDRARETLFNWLAPVLPGARVLDLFAGSGALGLEALSRGAVSAVLVERDASQARTLLEASLRLPGGEAASVVQADAVAWLAGQPRHGFDIAFVDPPFGAGLWDPVLAALDPVVAGDGWLYVEAPADGHVAVPAGWRLHREGRTREVRHALYRRAGGSPGGAADTLPDDPAGLDGRPTEAADQ